MCKPPAIGGYRLFHRIAVYRKPLRGANPLVVMSIWGFKLLEEGSPGGAPLEVTAEDLATFQERVESVASPALNQVYGLSREEWEIHSVEDYLIAHILLKEDTRDQRNDSQQEAVLLALLAGRTSYEIALLSPIEKEG